MPPEPNLERREALKVRSIVLRRTAHDLLARVKDPDMKELLLRLVIYRLDDLDVFLFGDLQNRPSAQSYEDTWLSQADIFLTGAESQFQGLYDSIEKDGGPDNVKVMGS
jgi:hypothetical protein